MRGVVVPGELWHPRPALGTPQPPAVRRRLSVLAAGVGHHRPALRSALCVSNSAATTDRRPTPVDPPVGRRGRSPGRCRSLVSSVWRRDITVATAPDRRYPCYESRAQGSSGSGRIYSVVRRFRAATTGHGEAAQSDICRPVDVLLARERRVRVRHLRVDGDGDGERDGSGRPTAGDAAGLPHLRAGDHLGGDLTGPSPPAGPAVLRAGSYCTESDSRRRRFGSRDRHATRRSGDPCYGDRRRVVRRGRGSRPIRAVEPTTNPPGGDVASGRGILRIRQELSRRPQSSTGSYHEPTARRSPRHGRPRTPAGASGRRHRWSCGSYTVCDLHRRCSNGCCRSRFPPLAVVLAGVGTW